MAEVQSHGFFFENWIRKVFVPSHSGGGYIAKWDISSDANRHVNIPIDFQNLPISVKTAKYASPIDLGDVIRQRSIEEPFLMIASFWRQRTPSEKWFEDIGWVKFTPTAWDSLWGTLSLTDLLEIDKIVKDRSYDYLEARKRAKVWKKVVGKNSGSLIVINPKIDSKNQRRVQCSLPFKIFWEIVGRNAMIQDNPDIFGIRFDANPHLSPPRLFK